MKLYRYIPALDRENGTQLYKGMIENLQCARLRFTNPATLNDPLEAVAPYTFRENGNVVTPNTKEIKEILSTHLGKNVWKEPRGKRILEVMPFGISLEYAIMLCLSKSENNQLMWAHYADYHRGICLEFDFPDSFCSKVTWSDAVIFSHKNFGLFCHCGDVNYEAQRKAIIFSDGIAENDYPVYDALLSKPDCWKYEQEYRVLLCYPIDSECKFAAGANTREYYFTYPKECLTSITFGMRLSEAPRESIIQCIGEAKYPDVTFKQEILVNNKFEIGCEKI